MGVYLCGHNLLLSHASAYRRYYEIYPEREADSANGNEGVSITFSSDWAEPRDPESQEDKDAAWRSMQFKIGWFAHPVWVNGDYPDIMKSMK